jgi:hypothetical protein
MPDIQIEYLSERKTTPLQADVFSEMPKQTFTSYREGWALEEVLPVGFHMYFESNRSGAFLFEPVDVFSICEVRPGGRDKEDYAVFDGDGRQITNALFNPLLEFGYTAWLPSGCSDRNTMQYYMDEGRNLYYPVIIDSYNSYFNSWGVFHIKVDPFYYYVLIAPNGKQIVYKTEDEKDADYTITNDGFLILSDPEYIIAYNRDGVPVFKLEYQKGEFSHNRVFGLMSFDAFDVTDSSGKMALYDNSGTRLTEFLYDSIWAYDTSYPIVGINGKYGLIDLTGKEILPCEYDSISCNSTTGVIICQNGKYGYMADAASGQWILPCIYEEIECLYGVDEYLVKENGSYYLWKD